MDINHAAKLTRRQHEVSEHTWRCACFGYLEFILNKLHPATEYSRTCRAMLGKANVILELSRIEGERETYEAIINGDGLYFKATFCIDESNRIADQVVELETSLGMTMAREVVTSMLQVAAHEVAL
ncbi:hypothetical protein D3C78_1261720 [compost metagenome]